MDPTAPKDSLGQGSNPSPKSSTPKDPVQPGQFVVAGEEDGIFKQPPPPNPTKPNSPPSYIASPNQTITDSSLNNNTSTPGLPSLGSKTDSSPLGWSSPFPANAPSDSSLPSGNLASLSTKSPPFAGVSSSPSLSEPESSSPTASSPSTPGPIEQMTPVAAPESPTLADISTAPSPSLAQESLASPTSLQPPPPVPAQLQPNPEPFIPPTIESTSTEEPSKLKKLRKIAIIVGALVLIAAVGAAAWFFVISKRIQKEPAKTEVVEEKVEEPPQIPKKTSGGFSELPPIPIESTQEATGASQSN